MHYNPENEANIQNYILGVFAGSTVCVGDTVNCEQEGCATVAFLKCIFKGKTVIFLFCVMPLSTLNRHRTLTIEPWKETI